jgi:PQQ-like domain
VTSEGLPVKSTKRFIHTVVGVAICGFALAIVVRAQGRGEWTTYGSDAQRTSWLRVDTRLTKDAVLRGELKFLWKLKLDNEARQLNSLTTPVIMDRLISHRGFKALAFVGGSAERIFAIDTDLARLYWTTVINYSSIMPPANSSWACPGGLMATATRPTSVTVSTIGAAGAAGRGGRSGSAVGEPGRGAAHLPPPPQGRAAAAPPSESPVGRGAPGAPSAVAAPGRGGGQGGGPADNVLVVASDGLVRTINPHNGSDRVPPIPFLPANAKPSSLILVDNVLYTTTSNGCGGTPNGVWAIDLGGDAKTVTAWKTGGPSVVGAAGPTLGTDGTIYVAVGGDTPSAARTSSTPNGQGGETSYADAIVALEPKTLTVKDWFTAPGAGFNASPIVVRHKDADLVLATANDGRLYLLDAKSLGGGDHKTPIYVTPKYTAGGGGGLAAWVDQGTQWILVPATGAAPAGLKFSANGIVTNGSIAAFKLVDQGGKPALEPGWTSRDLTSPLAPIVVGNLVFAVSSGEFRGTGASLSAAQRAQRSTPAILYVFDGATGKELWTSGKTITSFARAGLSAGGGQVYVVTYDNTIYAFGVPMEH